MNSSAPSNTGDPEKKDRRYKFVATVWRSGELTSLNDIFDIIPRSVVAADLGVNYERFTRKLLKPGGFYFREIERLSVLLDIPFEELSKLVAITIQNK
ncbi:hypothetical protein [Dinghuibacter silviterrae]|uniref:Uncharacterized protein n=1 Tax=Dinghuibacter silviterrae TaxID=1539049 RepID=A0A4V6Q9W0_9BACT|nr:hypothetical protein [Dinghuibacter silviterrae]TDW97152.1 hypothetical protein EDB95_4994 [Dinghuibacter silviterrae]